MKNKSALALLISAIFLSSHASAESSKTLTSSWAWRSAPEASEPFWNGQVGIFTGYRRDNINVIGSFLSAGVAGDTVSYNPSKWDDMNIGVVGVDLLLNMGKSLYFRGRAEYGAIASGRPSYDVSINIPGFQERLFMNGNLQGYTWDVAGALGYKFNFSHWSLAPVIGWAYDEQRTLTRHFNGYYTTVAGVPNGTTVFGQRQGNFHWSSPLVGVDLAYEMDRLTVWGTYEFHWAEPNANFSHNLTTIAGFATTDSFHEKLKVLPNYAYGNEIRAGLNYALGCSKQWGVGLSGNYEHWRGYKGTFSEKTSLSGAPFYASPGHLQSLTWNSWGITTELSYKF